MKKTALESLIYWPRNKSLSNLNFRTGTPVDMNPSPNYLGLLSTKEFPV